MASSAGHRQNRTRSKRSVFHLGVALRNDMNQPAVPDPSPRPRSRRVVFVTLILLLLTVLALVLTVFWHFLITLALATAMALLLRGVHLRLTRWFSGRAGLSAL